MDLRALEDSNADELVVMSESDTSTSTSYTSSDQTRTMFKGTKPLVLDLHNLERTKAKVDSGMNKIKRKVRRKRKSEERSKKTESSSSSSNTSLKKNTKGNKQFHDARENLPTGVAAASPVCAKPPPDTPKNSPGLSIIDNDTPTMDPVCKRADPAK